MTTANPEHGGLYSVPTPKAHRNRFRLWPAVKRLARKAVELFVTLSSDGPGWVIRHSRHLLAVIGRIPTIARLGAGVVVHLVRELGPLTVIAAVASIPAVWRAISRVTGWVVGRAASMARSLWSSVNRLLHETAAGTRISMALQTAGAAFVTTAGAVLHQPVARAVGHGTRLLVALIRPLAQTVFVHGVLALLIPVHGLRILLEVPTLIALLIPGLLSQLGRWRTTRPGHDTTAPLVVVEDSSGDNRDTGQPERTDRTTTTEQSDPTNRTTDSANEDPGAAPTPEADEPRNRAERRAQQQGQARARRAPKR